MGKSRKVRGLTGLLLVLIVASLGFIGSPVRAAEKRTLTVSTWGGVIGDMIKKHVQPIMEKTFNTSLVYDLGGSSVRYNKLLSRKAAPVVDVMILTDELVFKAISDDLIQKINIKNIPNVEQLYKWAILGEYGLGSFVDAYGIAYNPKLVVPPPTSWKDLWRPELKGKMAIGPAMQACTPHLLLNYAEINGGGINNIKPGLEAMAKLRPAKLSVFYTDWQALLQSGDIVMATEFLFYVNVMKDAGLPVEFVFPKEKAVGQVMPWCIIKGSKNVDIAEKFINVILSKEVLENIMKDGYLTPANRNVQIPPALSNRVLTKERLDMVRFYDVKLLSEKRADWTEMLNTQVAPHWQ